MAEAPADEVTEAPADEATEDRGSRRVRGAAPAAEATAASDESDTTEA